MTVQHFARIEHVLDDYGNNTEKLRAVINIDNQRKVHDVVETNDRFVMGDILREKYPSVIVQDSDNNVIESDLLSFDELIEIAYNN